VSARLTSSPSVEQSFVTINKGLEILQEQIAAADAGINLDYGDCINSSNESLNSSVGPSTSKSFQANHKKTVFSKSTMVENALSKMASSYITFAEELKSSNEIKKEKLELAKEKFEFEKQMAQETLELKKWYAKEKLKLKQKRLREGMQNSTMYNDISMHEEYLEQEKCDF
jgi:hypothetical protein